MAATPATLLAATVLAGALFLLVALFLLTAPPRAAAAAGELTVIMDRLLTQVNETPAFTVTGPAITGLAAGDMVTVSIEGPADLPQLTQMAPTLPLVESFQVDAASLPGIARPNQSQLHLPVPLAGLPAAPGAYRLTVEIASGGATTATGSTWMGRVAVRTTPLDLAFVWRAALGIHRGPDGVFFDTTLEQACAPVAGVAGPATAQPTAGAAGAAGGLPALLALPAEFPDWHFSLGVEPVLLTQLRDMANGFTRMSASGSAVEVGAADPAAKNAASVLKSFAGLADENQVEVAVSPYAGPDLGLLAAQGWRDGFDQLQLGKQEMVQTMGLGLPPSGAWSPNLDITTEGLGAYGQASIDHVLVDASVAKDLNEPSPPGTTAVRAHDDKNQRVTLVLADSQLRALMASPWDPSVLFAGMAALLASGDRDALVLSPDPDFALPPGAYLDAVGAELSKDSWIRTQTMADLLRAHPPGTRPVLLQRTSVPPSGYIGQTIFSAVQSAHAAVADLAVAADAGSLTLDGARHSLFVAESLWWSRPGVSPDEASAGLGYAVRAEKAAKDAFGAVALSGPSRTLILGHQGKVKLVGQNGGDEVLTAQLHLSGEGLRFPQGDIVTVRLEPGGNDIEVPVVGTSSTRQLAATLVAGATVLGKSATPVRFVTVTDILPWAGLAVAVVLAVVIAALFVRGRRRRRAV